VLLGPSPHTILRMTTLGFIARLAATWLSVAWFAFFVLDVLGHYDFAGRVLRATVAGFFVALSTAPAYYWRFNAKGKSQVPESQA
jgi:hypothetical protein